MSSKKDLLVSCFYLKRIIFCAICANFVVNGNSINYLCYDGSNLAQDTVAYAYNIEDGVVSINE